MDRKSLEKLSKEELIALLESAQARFADSNVHAAELIQKTEEAQAEIQAQSQALKSAIEKLQIYKAVLDNSSDFIGIADQNLIPIYCNSAGRNMVGIPLDKNISEINIPECYPEDLRGAVVNEIITTMQAKGCWEGETEFQHFVTKARIPVHDKHFMVLNEQGNPIGHATITRDISDDVKARKEKEIERRRYESLVKGLDQSAIVAVTDKAGKITFVNDLFCEISGYTKGELIGANHRILRSGFHAPEFYEVMWKTITSGKSWHGEVCNRKKDGSLYWVDTTITQIPGPKGEAQYMAIRFDITEKKNAIKKLLESSKMSSLGEMAGGIAHEINNPLAIIHGKASAMRRRFTRGLIDVEKSNEDLNKIEATVERISKIIKGLRSFSRNVEQDPMEKIKLQQVIDDTLELCKERFRNHNIDLKVNCPEDIIISCRPAQISQVIMNLLNNAHDAIEKFPQKWVSLDVKNSGSRIEISVTDSGTGISSEIVDKMMQPFFTTKEVGKGTGLGLSISKGIVEDHQGLLRYDSTSKNTRFVIELPIIEQGIDRRVA